MRQMKYRSSDSDLVKEDDDDHDVQTFDDERVHFVPRVSYGERMSR